MGTIEKVITNRGFGFIRQDDGTSIFFHVSSLCNRAWEDVRIGDRVTFAVGAGADGRRRAEGVSVQ